jgi:hypothetical protein
MAKKYTWFLIVAVNIAYASIFTSTSIPLLAILGLIVFLLSLAKANELVWMNKVKKTPNLSHSFERKWAILLILPFSIPFVSHPFSISIAFWEFDCGSQIAVAWLLFSVAWLNYSRSNLQTTPAVLPFVIWTTIIWMFMIWDIGVNELFSSEKLVGNDRFTNVFFPIWENYPISTHWGLGALSVEGFERGEVYSGITQTFLIITFIQMKIFSTFFEIPQSIAVRFIPFFYAVLMVISIWLYLRSQEIKLSGRPSVQITFFLCMGYLLTLPEIWVGPLCFNLDFPPFCSIYFVLILLALYDNHEISAKFVSLLIFLSFWDPYTSFLFILCFGFFVFSPICSESKSSSSKKKTIWIFIIAALFTSVSLLYPKIMVSFLGYSDTASSLLFRSGLDGDTTYFKNVAQAALDPFAESSRLFGSFFSTIFLVLFSIGWSRFSGSILSHRITPKWIIVFFPYLFYLVFFPQSISIHPYLYDFLAIFPLTIFAFTGIFLDDIQSNIKGILAPIFYLVLFGFVLHNLRNLAQAKVFFVGT